MHLVSALIFWDLGYTFLALWDAASTLLFFTAWVILLNRGSLIPPVLVILIEIPLRAALVTYYTGFTPAFWTYTLVSLMTLTIAEIFPRKVKHALAAYLLLATVVVAAIPVMVTPVRPLDPQWEAFFLVANVMSVSIIFYFVLHVFQNTVLRAEAGLKREYNRAEDLLKNILPDTIALRLKDGEHLIADNHAEVSVLFADIVNFTSASAKLKPAELVHTLNLVFSEFDRLAAKHGAEKIKTIGDAYMAVVGVPDSSDTHADTAVSLALDMLQSARDISAKTHFPIELRIGINTGPVVAGVIGQNKFAYDLWGDAVNVASRMESLGEPGQILITDATRQHLTAPVRAVQAGERAVKGKGEMPVFTIEPAPA